MISVVIPTYNRSALVCNAIESLLSQTNPDWECIVVDDHSTDNTKFVVDSYVQKDSRISYVLNKRKKGAQGARNTGILESKSDWVLLLDSDNGLESNYVERISEFVQNNPNVDVVTNFIKIEIQLGTDSDSIGSNDWATEGDVLKCLLSGNTYVDNSSACIRKSKLLEIGLLDENCPSFQEWDTHIRLAQNSLYGYIPERLTIYLDHRGNRVSSGVKTIWANGLYVLKKHRRLWLKETNIDVYSHFLIEVYNKAQDKSLWYRIKVFVVIISLCPKLLKQFCKKIMRS